MTIPTHPRFNRRDFIKLSGSLAAASFVAACTPQENTIPDQKSTEVPNPVLEQIPQLTNINAPLAAIALNRMSFGPRPAEIEAFNALGATDEERLHAYVREQLNPDSIDDSEFESRYANAGFETL